MSIYPAQTTTQGSIFNPDLWVAGDSTTIDADYLNANYLKFSVAQGYETLNGATNLGDLDMSNNDILNLGSITSDTALTGQITFSLPPHSVDPILGDDLTTKGYVDSLVGQYSGGFNLYLNYSESLTVNSISYKKLSQTVSSAAQQSVITTTNGTNQLIASFISDAINITEIPTGLWSLYLYGGISATGGVVYYFFKIRKNSGGVLTDIATSGNSIDINATPSTNPDVYHMNATINTAVSVLLTDRIIIEVYCIKISGVNVDLTTYFESSYYSYIQTTLNAGTTLLGSNNNWLGSNIFNGDLRVNSTLTDTSGDVGTAGQVLSSTGTGTNWITTTASGSSYVAYTASATLSTSVNPTLFVIVSGTTVGIVITIPATGYALGQVIQVKNNATNIITISTSSTIYIYSSIGAGASLTIDSGDVANLFYNGFTWLQYSPSNKFTKLIGANGCIAGQTNYVAINTSTLPQTVSTVTNLDMFVFLTGSTALRVLNIPVPTFLGQRIQIKNTATVDVSIAFPTSSVMLFDSIATASAVVLKSKGVISLYWGSAFWMQTVPSDALTDLTTSSFISAGTTITAGTGITATAGNITASSGSVSASTALLAPSVNALADTSNLGICSTQSIGVLNLCVGPRTKSNGTAEGNINIGTGVNTITSGTLGPSINIGNNASTLNRTEINIGSTNTKTTINGPLSITGAISAVDYTGTGFITTPSNISTTGTGSISTTGTGSITSASTITAGTGITATSGNIAASGGNILGQILRNNTNTGSISQTGVINGSAMTTPSLTTATATTLSIGTSNATAINIGVPGLTTTINGELITTDNYYISTVGTTATTPTTGRIRVEVNQGSRNINLSLYNNEAVFINTGTGGGGGGFTLPLVASAKGYKFTFRSVQLTATTEILKNASDGNCILTIGAKAYDVASATNLVSMASGTTRTFISDGTFWVQI